MSTLFKVKNVNRKDLASLTSWIRSNIIQSERANFVSIQHGRSYIFEIVRSIFESRDLVIHFFPSVDARRVVESATTGTNFERNYHSRILFNW